LSADPRRPADGRYGWRLSLAGALAGIAAGGLLVSLLTHLGLTRDWYAFGHPPAAEIAAALLGALGVWCFSSGRSVDEGMLGMGAAFLAMLLGDAFRVMAATAVDDWQWVPHELSRSFHWRYWPRLMCYAFGVYIGWYVGTAPRPGGPAGRPDDIDEETD